MRSSSYWTPRWGRERTNSNKSFEPGPDQCQIQYSYFYGFLCGLLFCQCFMIHIVLALTIVAFWNSSHLPKSKQLKSTAAISVSHQNTTHHLNAAQNMYHPSMLKVAEYRPTCISQTPIHTPRCKSRLVARKRKSIEQPAIRITMARNTTIQQISHRIEIIIRPLEINIRILPIVPSILAEVDHNRRDDVRIHNVDEPVRTHQFLRHHRHET